MAASTGKLLRVDLTSGTHRTERIDPRLAIDYIGGRGIAVKVFCGEVDPGVEPFSPENKLIFAAGVLTGTGAITGCKYTVVTKSPLSGAIATSSSEGFFGTEMKQAGYDLLVLEGKAPSPAYLEISDGKVELVPAGHIWGLTTSQAEDLIKQRMHDKWKAMDACIACIGPAGEKLSRMASIVNDRYWGLTRSGVGAVMGAKNLKAVVLSGTQDLALATSKTFMTLVEGLLDQVKSAPMTSQTLPGQGSAFMVDTMARLGALPWRNFAGGETETASFDGGAVQRFVSRQMGCFSCPIGCEHLAGLPDKGLAAVPEYEALASLGPGCGVSDLVALTSAHKLCLELGLDPVSTGGAIACAMELFEKGAVSEKETGTPLKFGDSAALLQMVERIGRRQGFGDIVAEGGARLAAKYGHPELFMGVKGQECPPCDPRALQALALQYATANNGACYFTGDVVISELFSGEDGPEPGATEGKAAVVKDAQDLAAVLDSSGLCRKMLLGEMSIMEVYAMMEMATASGLGDAELLRAGERIFNLERMFNLGAGLTARDDTLPARMLEEPLPGGAARGQVACLGDMLSEYYQLRGWDVEGRPTPQRLEELGLTEGAIAR